MNKQTKIITGVVVVAALLGGVTLYRSANTANTIKIGVIAPLTGSGAGVYGEPLKKGIDLAVGEINKTAKTPYEVVYEDYQLDPKLALSAYQKLKAEGVKYFVFNGTPADVTVGPEIKKDGNIAIDPSSLTPAYNDGSPLTCRIALTATNYGPQWAELVANTLGKKKVVILFPEYDAGIAMKDAFKKEFEAKGGQIVGEEKYLKDATDFKSQITKLKANKDADVIVTINYFKSADTMLKQMKELGLNKTIVTDNWTINNAALVSKDNVNGAYFVDYKYSLDSANTDQTTKDFITAFQGAYNAQPGLQSAQGYNIARIVTSALEDQKKDPSAVSQFMIANMRDYKIVGGTISFNNDCEVERDTAWRRIEQGRVMDVN